MITALTLLLAFQLAGETLTRLLNLPIPGPVLGMALLFIALLLRGGPNEPMRQLSTGLLQHLALLFIPAGTGILLHLHRLADDWLALTLAVCISTLISMAVTALLMQWLDRRPHAEESQHD